jgi:outer membrane lipoprotein SlyB
MKLQTLDHTMNHILHTLSVSGLIALSTLALTGCDTASQGSKTYTRGQAQQQMQVSYGVVLHVAAVTIEPETTGGGAAVGAATGGIAGSMIGSGRGSTLAAMGGALAGAAAGSKAEQNMRTVPGHELEVELDDGRILVIVQEADDVFNKGDHVRVITDSRGVSRVRQ